MTGLLIAALAIGLCLVMVAIAILLDNRQQADVLLPAAWEGPSAGKVSVIVPARNEAHQIRRCLESLLAQDYPDWELLVVDDRSEDDTWVILQDLARQDSRLEALMGQELPAGWMGKSWAAHQAVLKAEGDWLLFTDADTWHHPHGLSSAVRYMRAQQADFMTTMPYQECKSFWEHVVQPVVVLSSLTAKPLRRMEDERSDDVIATGQFLLFRRGLYDKTGGHAAIRSSVVDDVSLAKAVRRHGGKLKFPQGAALVRVRMYCRFEDLWQGWSKNMFGGAGGDWRLALTAAVVWTLASVWPWLVLPWYLWRVAGGDPAWDASWGAGLAGLNVLATLVIRNLALRRLVDHGLGWSLTHPLGFCVFSLMMLNSMRRGLLGLGPQWKGRVYPGMHL